MTVTVRHYDTDEHLAGTASPELVRQSAATPTGAASACVDGFGVWHYVAPGGATRDMQRYCGREIITVYVEDTMKPGPQGAERRRCREAERTRAEGLVK